MSHDTADTRVTAYVFGELPQDQRKAFEQELAQSSQLRDEVASVQEAVAAICAELQAESKGVDELQRKEIEQAIGDAALAIPAVTASSGTLAAAIGGRKLMAMLALAASVMLVCGLVYTNLPENRELSMNDERSPAPATVVPKTIADGQADAGINTTDSAAHQGVPEVVEKGAMKGSYAGGGEALSQSLSEEPLDRQLGRSSKAVPQDDLLFRGAAVAGQENRKSDAPVTLQADNDGIQQAAPRGGAAAIASPSPSADAPASRFRMMRETEPQDEYAVSPRSDFEISRPAPQPANVQLQVRPQIVLTEEIGESIATKQAAPRRRSRRSGDSMMGVEADGMQMVMEGEMMTSGGSALPEAQVQFQGVGRGAPGAEALGIAGADRTTNLSTSAMTREMGMGGMEMEMGMGMGGMGPGMAGDRYELIEDNPFLKVEDAPLSTFSVDVDTAAYAKVRMYLMQQNTLPRPAAVRIEELVNYFHYDYRPPTDEHPFAAAMDVAECPWNPDHRLARIGIKGKVIDQQRPPSNLVFLLDVSGSMNRPNKLPLVIEGMTMLADQLTENDSVAIVVYAGNAGLVLDSTSGAQQQTIINALERLRAGGSTDGGSGIKLAYDIARDHFIVGGTNRVILCTDGDFNVGVTGTDALVRLAEENAKSNIYLSIFGFGMGNHNDEMMEKVSNKANGNYAFIDSKSEAHKVLVEELGATLVTIAKDVKIQVEFNPKEIASYRLIGYENRIMAAQDFNDDTKDAGEIGAGHTVTALYELVPAGADSNVTIPPVDDLRYQKKTRLSKEADSGEALTLKLRYKQPDAAADDESTLIQFPVVDEGKKFGEMDEDFQFASAVASFGMLLRKSPHKGDSTFAAVEEIAAASVEDDARGYRAEFLKMVARAKELSGE